jgi:N6-L-threonylcarbamoyladenine synthase
MKILAIETSCDETAICIINFRKGGESFVVEKNELISQIDIHREYGGVYPHMAKREHIKNLPILLEKVIGDEKNFKNIDYIAVTNGPGLSPALWTGIEIAKKISLEYNIPIYPINHMEGHIFASTLLIKNKNSSIKKNINRKSKGPEKEEWSFGGIKYPAISLLISGGHTELIFMDKEMHYKKVGVTLDDAVGEAFDKVARTLGYPYPGGPEISKRAEIGRKVADAIRDDLRLPRPMMYTHDLNFSFSGLKTSVINKVEKYNLEENEKELFCMEFENAVTDVLVKKTRDALYLYNAKTLIIGGGVSANKHIRNVMSNMCLDDNVKLYIPDRTLSTDNALMIAAAGFMKIRNNIPPIKVKELSLEKLRAEPNLSLESK